MTHVDSTHPSPVSEAGAARSGRHHAREFGRELAGMATARPGSESRILRADSLLAARGWLALAILLGCLPLSAAVLNGNLVPLGVGTNLNLTSLGTLDWVHWGLAPATNFNRRISATPRIGTLLSVGENVAQQLTTNQVGLSWSDGTPCPAVTNSPTGLFVQGLKNGFEITTEADAERRRLYIFAGVEAATGLLEAGLSDASASSYYDESLTSFVALSNGVFVVDFAAASGGQTLTVRLTAQSLFDPNTGRIGLQAVALASNRPPAVWLTSPTNNARFFHSASVLLAAEATDAEGAIERVEFYQGPTRLGEAFEAPYTFQWDNVAPGTYNLTARAFDNDGIATISAPMAITVLANYAPTVTLTNPANFASFAVPASILLGATASDVDGTITKVEFYRDNQKLGVATTRPFLFNWTNLTAGEFLLTARATDNLGAIAASAAVDVFFTQPGGYLAAAPGEVTESVLLDAEGPADWAHWGLYTGNSFNHKCGVVPQLATYSVIGNETVHNFYDNSARYSWTDGTPTASATNTATGVFMFGLQNGFGLQAPAGLTTNTLKVYVGAYAARGRMLAYLSDFSTPVVSDFSVNHSDSGPNMVYTFRYAASAPGRMLNLRWLVDGPYASDGNITLLAAALDTGNLPPTAVLTSPPGGATFLAPTNITLYVQAADADGKVTKVEFFRNELKLGQTTNSPYAFVWTNAPPGSHRLTARATDDRGVTFTARPVDVFVSLGGGSLGVTSAFPAAQIDLPAEGLMDWTHWGLSKANSFDHRAGASTRLSNVTRVGSGGFKQFTDNFTGYSWTNGTPTPTAAGSRTGIYMEGLANGFQITAPADPARRRLKVYVGLYAARGRFEAALSDNSARSFTDISLASIYGNNYRVYTIDYASATPGKQLIVRQTCEELFDADYGNVTLQSATLADLPPPRLLDAAWDGQAFRFRITTLPDRTYTVECADALPATRWKFLERFSGSGTHVWVTNSFPSSPQHFYRAVEY